MPPPRQQLISTRIIAPFSTLLHPAQAGFFMGLRPKPALLFLIAEKDPAGRLAKKLAPRAAVRRTNLFLSGRFTTPYGRTSKMPLYSVKNKFYRRLQRGAKTENNQSKKEERHLARTEEKSTLKRGRFYLIRECFKKKLIFRFGGLRLGRG